MIEGETGRGVCLEEGYGRGAAQIALSAVCLLSIRSIGVVVVVYCVGLLTTGITKVVSAFRKTEIVYVR